MKNQYFGDFKDFCKYGLLRFLSNCGENGLKTGVCWMLTEPDDKAQGMDVKYLDKPEKYADCDPELFEYLNKVIPIELKLAIKKEKNHEERMKLITKLIADTNVLLLENNPIMPNCVYYNCPKTIKGSDDTKQCDLLFFDPDNGILVKSYKDLSKYISHPEMQLLTSAQVMQYT